MNAVTRPAAFAGLRAAVIDLDGTLVDTLGDFVVALNGALTELGRAPIDRAFVARTVGKGSEHLVRSALRQVGGDAALAASGLHIAGPDGADRDHHAGPDAGLYSAARSLYQRHYLAVNGQHATVYPGVVEGLTALRAHGLRLACLTNKPTAFALPLLRKKGLDGFFDHVFGGDAFERQKPDPLPLIRTCEALGVAPASTLMVGDSSNDARAARAAGCPVVLVSYGYNHGEPVASVDADGVVDRLDALPGLLHF